MGLLLIATLLTAAPQVQAQTLAGRTLSGSLVELSDEAAVVATADGNQRLIVKELMGLSLPTAGNAGDKPPVAWVTLADGSTLELKSFAASGGQIRMTLRSGVSITAPAAALALDSVSFREHTGPLAEQWAEIAKADRSGDLLVVRKNDALDFLGGVIHDVDDEIVQFELDGEVRRVKKTRVDGLLYGVTGRKPLTAPYCTLSDGAGSQLRLAALALSGEALRVRTAGGVEIAWPLAAVARLDYSQGNLHYLADLKPESINWQPYLGEANDLPGAAEFFRPRVDGAIDGGPLRLGGREYPKGLSARSRTEITYRLPERYRTFQATVGIDDRLRPAGNVHLVIRGDDRVLFEGAVTGKDEPRALELDLSGVNRLTLLVDFGDDLDVADALNVCDARIAK